MALSELDAPDADLSPRERRHIVRLTGEWAMLSDFCFSDLLLYVPVAGGEEFAVVAHMRPSTSQTIYHTDLVGERRNADQRPVIAEALETGAIVTRDIDSNWLGDRIQVMAIPVRRDGRVIAVLARESPRSIRRVPGELEQTYRAVFDRFARMIAEGSFPFDVDPKEVLAYSPRVGDGVVVVDADRSVRYSSPNATSALNRAGISEHLGGRDALDVGLEHVGLALLVGRPVAGEIEVGDASVAYRAIPLRSDGANLGAVVLVRDVSDLRRRDRMLVSKDATIREIHHRVKNNLQTISSLLRLQGRRLTEPSAKTAIEESVRRIRSIAIVHEILSRDTGDDVSFGEVLRPLVRMVEEGLVSAERPVRFTINGDAGIVSSPTATSLAVVLTELLQNVVEHAYPAHLDLRDHPGLVRLEFQNDGTILECRVVDDGVGLPDSLDVSTSTSLGLSIVRNLVTSELGGRIEARRGDGVTPRVGTVVELSIPTIDAVTAEAPVRDTGMVPVVHRPPDA